MARSFPLKNGTCHVFPDRIELRQGGILLKLLQRMGGRMLFFNLLVGLSMLIGLVFVLWIENYLLAAFFAAMAAFYGYLSWQQRRLSITNFILKERIEKVAFRPAVPGQARASFVITFRDKRGRRLVRILNLPTRTEQGEMVVQSAVLLMREEGLLETNT